MVTKKQIQTFVIFKTFNFFLSPDKRENIKTTAYVGMFKAKILVIGPREVRRKEIYISMRMIYFQVAIEHGVWCYFIVALIFFISSHSRSGVRGEGGGGSPISSSGPPS